MIEYNLLTLAEGLKDGRWTARDLVDMYLEQIQSLDQNGPHLNSIAEINPEVYDIADAMDWELKTKGPRSLLHGIPIIIKDNIQTKDKMHTSASSYALKDFYAPEDAFLVKKLRAAGMVLLGKANLSEFAYFMSFGDMPSGYGSRFGQVKSPYSDKIDPLGSSTGSAVAVASNLIPVSIGTETNGSLTAPAQNNAIVTIKPTLGMVSRSGIIPITHTQDTAGPMGRSVEDVAILYSLIYGTDQDDLATWQIPEKDFDFQRSYQASIESLRIGFLTFEDIDYADEEKAILSEAKTVLKDKVKAMVDISVKLPELENVITLLHEFKVDINHYFNTVSPDCPIKHLADLIDFNKKHEDICLKYGQSIFEAAEKTSGTLKEPEYLKAKKTLVKNARQLSDLLEMHQLDCLVMNRRTTHAPVHGNPVVAVPAKALTDEEPRSLFFVAKRFDDDIALRVAYHYEQATKKRVPPTLK